MPATLVATEPPLGLALLDEVLGDRTAAGVRVVIDDLVHPILGAQLTARTTMPALTASLTPAPSRRISSFALARASARRCARVLGGSIDGGLALARES